MPTPIFIVTTRKANGAANANLHAWGFLVGERDRFPARMTSTTEFIDDDCLLMIDGIAYNPINNT